jgi:hypothetical protein
MTENDKRRPWPERRRLEPSPAYRHDTPLQRRLAAILVEVRGAQAELSDDQWRAFVEILTDVLGHEAARLLLGEALRATREPAA